MKTTCYNNKYGLTKYDKGLYILYLSDNNLIFNHGTHSDALVNVNATITTNGLDTFLEVEADKKILDCLTYHEFSKDFIETVEDRFVKKLPIFKTPYIYGWFFYKKTKPYKTVVKNFQIVVM